jgi:hypothetical protein
MSRATSTPLTVSVSWRLVLFGGTDCTGFPVTAVLARPARDRLAPNTPAGHAREDLRSTTIQREKGKDDGNRRREKGRYRDLRKASDSACGGALRRQS